MSSRRRKLIDTNMPRDEKLQAAVGRVAIRHGQLDHFLRMTIKSISGMTLEETQANTKKMTSGPLRKYVRKVAKEKLGKDSALDQLDALLIRSCCATDERNKLMHALWALGEDGEQQYRPAGGRQAPVPTVQDFDLLAEQLNAIAEDMNTARRKGFLKDALELKRSQELHFQENQ